MQRVVFITLCALLTGCASQKPSSDDARVQLLQKKLRQQAAHLQDLKEINRVLEKRQQLKAAEPSYVTSEPPQPLPQSFQAKAVTPPNLPTKLPAKLPPKQQALPPITISPDETGDHFFYSKVLETYAAKNSEELDRTIQLMLKSYPESTLNDDAIYMSGLLSFEKQDYRSALRQFDRLLKDYPRSNKAVAALFAKASIEKRVGRSHEAKRSFLQVKDLFPGSPEAARVSVELKLLESASMKRRES